MTRSFNISRQNISLARVSSEGMAHCHWNNSLRDSYLGQRSVAVTAERWSTRELTDRGGVHEGGEEGDEDKLQLEHGIVGPTGLLVPSEGIHAPFYILSPISCGNEKPSARHVLRPIFCFLVGGLVSTGPDAHPSCFSQSFQSLRSSPSIHRCPPHVVPVLSFSPFSHVFRSTFPALALHHPSFSPRCSR